MKSRNLFFVALLSLSLPLSALAVSSPIIDTIPSSVDASSYTLIISVDTGAKVTVVGGPTNIAPVTDGADSDLEDGEVQITVGLSQNSVNTFSIKAEKDDNTSDSVIIEINEVSEVPTGGGDHTPPSAPDLNIIPDMIETAEYMITGDAEANAKIYAYNTFGIVLGTATADADGYFQLTVELELNKTNRVNVTAEDENGNESSATQAVIRQSSDVSDPPEEEDAPVPELYVAPQVFFNDTVGHWAKDYIDQLFEREVVSGKSEGVFEPNGYITRAELTKIAILGFGHSMNTSVDSHPFQDVPRNSWFAPYVEEAQRLDFVSGYPSGGFGPNDFITRAAALKIILLASGVELAADLPEFDDVAPDAWFSDYVGYAAANDIVSGYGDGRFGPGDSITRAAVAKIVVKTLELKNQ